MILFAIIAVAILVVVGGSIAALVAKRKAPEGYEDETGFHEGKRPE